MRFEEIFFSPLLKSFSYDLIFHFFFFAGSTQQTASPIRAVDPELRVGTPFRMVSCRLLRASVSHRQLPDGGSRHLRGRNPHFQR